MAKKKLDGIVEVVHYDEDGKIAWVRAYERTGYVYTDRIVLERDGLVSRLESGKNFYTGKRTRLSGHEFETVHRLRLESGNGSTLIVAGDSSQVSDFLDGVPVI